MKQESPFTGRWRIVSKDDGHFMPVGGDWILSDGVFIAACPICYRILSIAPLFWQAVSRRDALRRSGMQVRVFHDQALGLVGRIEVVVGREQRDGG